ncbi:ribosomal protein S18 acetylase RimI-like enzyme [Paenibacillus castaneae]|uniref:GNAT family N-acetyltransferase n=1 Tax=Paenibacillus castaneae TaxID=474957 RepID=UPI000C9B2612|nr:GNAT family N-acetyltransferase [Paenibacillus castaneae]NIK76264.1 ribosomal protein S18 acetylase RimI-like enzyme [Paenibacillus castaneae]
MIGPAEKEDVQQVLPLLLSAIGSIAYSLAGTDDQEEAEQILADFYTSEDNRISYKHVLVDRREGEIAGMLVSYSGDQAELLDLPFVMRPGRELGTRANEKIAVEALAGEFYLDSLAVDERYQGQGIAKALIAAFEQRGIEAGSSKLSLIVEPNNAGAYALYKKMNYIEEGSIEVSGNRYLRMVKYV